MDISIDIGKFGTIQFPSGYYVYTGSALDGLNKRIMRHKRSRKKLRWHIDHFLRKAKIIKIFTYITNQKLECELNRKVQRLPNARILVKGFGSSDCKCPSHLTFFGNTNPTNLLNKIKFKNY